MRRKSRYGAPQFEFIEEAFDLGFNFPPFELYPHQVQQLELFLNSPHFADESYKGTSLYNPDADGYRNFASTWPRRSGKDLTPAVFIAMVLIIVPGRTAYYLFPRLKRAQRFWFLNNTRIPECPRLYKMFPEEVLVPGRKYNKNTDVIELLNDSALILGGMGGGGEDFKDPLDRGGDLDIVVYSECAWLNSFQPVAGFAPMGMARKHISIYPSTPRGKNHFYRLVNPYRECNREKMNPADKNRWHVSELTREETFNNKGELLVSQEEYDAYVEQFGEAMALQEFYGSFDGPGIGAVYTHCLEKLWEEAAERVRPDLKIQPHLTTYTGWDWGQSNATVITIAQLDGAWLNIVDQLEFTGNDVRDIVKTLLAYQKKHKILEFAKHVLPHDMSHKTQHVGSKSPTSLNRIAKQAGLMPVHQLKVSKSKVDVGAAAVRVCFPWFRFQAIKCKKLLEALETMSHPVDPETGYFDESKFAGRKGFENDRHDSLRTLCEYLHNRLPKKGFLQKKADESKMVKARLERFPEEAEGAGIPFRRSMNRKFGYSSAQKDERRRLVIAPKYKKGENYLR